MTIHTTLVRLVSRTQRLLSWSVFSVYRVRILETLWYVMTKPCLITFPKNHRFPVRRLVGLLDCLDKESSTAPIEYSWSEWTLTDDRPLYVCVIPTWHTSLVVGSYCWSGVGRTDGESQRHTDVTTVNIRVSFATFSFLVENIETDTEKSF